MFSRSVQCEREAAPLLRPAALRSWPFDGVRGQIKVKDGGNSALTKSYTFICLVGLGIVNIVPAPSSVHLQKRSAVKRRQKPKSSLIPETCDSEGEPGAR
ncbi:hypothetical protein AAFF_G00322710 [Aldrovandia affinis]|uniref:Uncharacterized protein n=1 Tax=Aldrovandia affinis TaxID=143900 RepID=A0AAD7SMP8_9TELE|nr:hypothetical protein AAFF_G00322710 [Aldrovandia affinis]